MKTRCYGHNGIAKDMQNMKTYEMHERGAQSIGRY